MFPRAKTFRPFVSKATTPSTTTTALAPRSRLTPREYFYVIDVHGYLYLEETASKNFTSAFKNKPFLDFFFSRLDINSTSRYKENYPFLSRCGPELNYVRADDAPIVYTDLTPDRHNLIWGGGTLKTPFNPALIYVSEKTGFMYHPAPFQTSPQPLWAVSMMKDGDSTRTPTSPLGLLSSALVQANFAHMIVDDVGACGGIQWNGKVYPFISV